MRAAGDHSGCGASGGASTDDGLTMPVSCGCLGLSLALALIRHPWGYCQETADAAAQTRSVTTGSGRKRSLSGERIPARERLPQGTRETAVTPQPDLRTHAGHLRA